MFQSTPPRGGRLFVEVLVNRGCSVSIHAPAWGATREHIASGTLDIFVSIHAPAWGATRTSYVRLSRYGCFNPRPRVGGDRIFKFVLPPDALPPAQLWQVQNPAARSSLTS